MKKILIVLTLITVLPFFVFGQAKAKKAEKEVLEAIDKLAEAGLKRDVATIERLYSEDFFHTNADGSIMTREQVIASYKAEPKAMIESNRQDETRVQIYKNAAVVSNRTTLKGKINNQPFERLFRVTYFLRKNRGEWQIVASHASLIL